ncbi:hypothetical protein [Streptococcus fryi]
MLIDEQYKWLAEQAYWVDGLRDDVNYHPKKSKIYNYNPDDKNLGQFQVLAVEDNQTNDIEVLAMRLREVC